MVQVLEGLAGAVVVVAALLDVFQSVVTPRPVAGRLRISRAEYAGRVNALAVYWSSPPAQWIGDMHVLKRTGHGDRPPPGARRARR